MQVSCVAICFLQVGDWEFSVGFGFVSSTFHCFLSSQADLWKLEVQVQHHNFSRWPVEDEQWELIILCPGSLYFWLSTIFNFSSNSGSNYHLRLSEYNLLWDSISVFVDWQIAFHKNFFCLQFWVNSVKVFHFGDSLRSVSEFRICLASELAVAAITLRVNSVIEEICGWYFLSSSESCDLQFLLICLKYCQLDASLERIIRYPFHLRYSLYIGCWCNFFFWFDHIQMVPFGFTRQV